jgi:hypothetical protein
MVKMKPLVLVLVLAATALAAVTSAAAAAAPSTQDAAISANLQLRPKAALPQPAKTHRFAPFVAPLDEPDLDLLPRADPRNEASRSSCSGESALCYDPGSGRIVYKPARALMPDLPGLQPENISVKRDRITFRYSF